MTYSEPAYSNFEDFYKKSFKVDQPLIHLHFINDDLKEYKVLKLKPGIHFAVKNTTINIENHKNIKHVALKIVLLLLLEHRVANLSTGITNIGNMSTIKHKQLMLSGINPIHQNGIEIQISCFKFIDNYNRPKSIVNIDKKSISYDFIKYLMGL